MTLDANQFRDPMLVLMDKQAAEERKHGKCRGCEHHIQLFLMGRDLNRCKLTQRYGTKDCTKFTEKVNK